MQRDRYLTVIRPRASDIRNDSSWPVLPLKKRKKKEENLSLFLSLIGRNHPGKVFDSNDLIFRSILSLVPSISYRETKDGEIARIYRENKRQREEGFEKWEMRWQRVFSRLPSDSLPPLKNGQTPAIDTFLTVLEQPRNDPQTEVDVQRNFPANPGKRNSKLWLRAPEKSVPSLRGMDLMGRRALRTVARCTVSRDKY